MSEDTEMDEHALIKLVFPNYSLVPNVQYWRRDQLRNLPYFDRLFDSGYVDSDAHEFTLPDDPMMFTMMIRAALGTSVRERFNDMTDFYGLDLDYDAVKSKSRSSASEKRSVHRKRPTIVRMLETHVSANEQRADLIVPTCAEVLRFDIMRPTLPTAHMQRNMHFGVTVGDGTAVEVNGMESRRIIAHLLNKSIRDGDVRVTVHLSQPVPTDVDIYADMHYIPHPEHDTAP
jgi:hypothetical protein